MGRRVVVGVLAVAVLGVAGYWYVGETRGSEAPGRAQAVGDWESAFYSMEPPSTLHIRADGTWDFRTSKGHWSYRFGDLSLTSETGSKGFVLHFEQDGRMLSDGVADGAAFVRLAALKFESNVRGIWSTDAHPRPGQLGSHTLVLDDNLHPKLDGKEVAWDTESDHLSLTISGQPEAKLYPSADFNQLIQREAPHLTLTRVPLTPLREAILGAWTCADNDSPASWKPVVFSEDGTFLHKGKRGKWRVEGNHVVLDGLVGRIVTLHPPTENGLKMRENEGRGLVLIRE